MSHEHHEHEHCKEALHLGFDIAKLVMKGLTLAATVCIAKNLYKVHKSIEAHKK